MSLSVLPPVARSNEHATMLKEKSRPLTCKSLHYIGYQIIDMRYDIINSHLGLEKKLFPYNAAELGLARHRYPRFPG
jgi:hypothetical protein